MRICLIFVCLSFLWFSAVILRAAEHYVVPSNPAATDPYTSWDTAGTSIIDVVNAAMTDTTTPRIVWVSNGVYVLTNQILITNALTLRSVEGHGPDDTVINGNYTPGAFETNRCLFMSNESALVHGFTISNGGCSGGQSGGGVSIYSGILSNCTVCNNTVIVPAASESGGGGIYMCGPTISFVTYCSGTVIACRVTGNIVTNLASGKGGGGGIQAWGSGGKIINCMISNNVIVGASTSSRGGGIYAGSRFTVESSMICNNQCSFYCGGIYMTSLAIMQTCTVTVNQATTGLGGCELEHGTITNCLISYNKSPNDSLAGGLHLLPTTPSHYALVYNTTIAGNSNVGVVMNSLTYNGNNQMINCVITGSVFSGMIMCGTNDHLLNCEVRGNKGGGILCRDGTIRNCLVAGNTTNGGILIASNCKTASVSCCTIANNWSTNSGSGLRIESTSPSLITVSSCVIYSNGVNGTDDVYDACAPINYGALQYSCIGSNPGFTGSGIIVANPLFAAFASGNYRLCANSPCINRGTNQGWMTNSIDLDGRTRIRYGTVDMGAYEAIYNGTVYTVH